MTARRQDGPDLAVTSIRLHGWTAIGASLGILALVAGTALAGISSIALWVQYGLLAIISVMSALVGAWVIRSASQRPKRDPVTASARPFQGVSLLLLALGVFLTYQDIRSSNASGSIRTGVLWMVAGGFGLAWTRRAHRPEASGQDPVAGVLAVVAAAMYLAGIIGADPPGGVPFQQWNMVGLLWTAPGVLGAVAVLVAAITQLLRSRAASSDASKPFFAGLLAVAVILWAVAVLITTFGFVFDFRWQQLANPPGGFLANIPYTAAFYLLVATIMLWTVAAAVTLAAGGVALVRHAEAMDFTRVGTAMKRSWAGLRNRRRRDDATGTKGAPKKRTLTCPNCNAKTTMDVHVPPVCPKCWYSGPK